MKYESYESHKTGVRYQGEQIVSLYPVPGPMICSSLFSQYDTVFIERYFLYRALEYLLLAK